MDFIKSAARGFRETFKDPDDDWQPTGLVHDANGVHAVPIDPQWFNTDERKVDLANLIAAKLVETKAVKFGLMISSWAITVEEMEKEGTRPMDHPDRREQLHLEVFDAERQEMWWAPVLRDGEQPPALGDWHGPSLEGVSVFSESIQDALR